MTSVLSIKEFNRLSIAGAKPLERIYQGKSLIPGPVFSVVNLNAAQLYCQRFSKTQHATAYIIVEEKNYLRIWTENIEHDINSSLEPVSEAEISINELTIETEFINICQKKLATYIGPIAKVICKKALSKKPKSTRKEFVEILVQKISDPEQAESFKKELLY